MDPRHGSPAKPDVSYHRDTDTLSVGIRHREADGVCSATTSYMTKLEMRPSDWRAYLAAVAAELERVEAAEKERQPDPAEWAGAT